MLFLTDTSPACGPKVVAGRAVQGEVVESEDTVLKNSLTYKKRCVHAAVCGLGGKGEGGREGTRSGKGRGSAATTSLSPPQVCGKRKGQDGHT